MSRKRNNRKKKNNFSDIKYNSELLSKFINLIMINGKKTLALNIVYSSINLLNKNNNTDNLFLFKKILDKIKPIIEVKTRRIGGTNYQVPIEINPNRSNALAMRWIIEFSRKRKEKSMILRLYNEFTDILNDKSESIKKRDNVHKLAESNKTFSHYKW